MGFYWTLLSICDKYQNPLLSHCLMFTLCCRYINSLYSHTPFYYGVGGNSAVLSLDAGDVVYVKSRSGQDSPLYGRGDEVYCTFSGYLIQSSGGAGQIIG